MSRLTIPLSALLGAVLGAGAMLWGSGHFAPLGDRSQIEQVVHDYLLAHPEVLPDAMDALRDKQHARTIADNRAAILEPFGSAWAGSAHPDLTIVEYYDYNCGYCRASLPAIAQLLASDPKLRIVFREFPVLADSSASAARMSLAAAEQGKFKPFHDALYAGGPVTDRSIAAAAKVAGVDPARAAAFAPTADAEIAANMGIARQLGLTGTPSWVIGNHVVSSALPLDELQKLVAQARAKS
ncbi:DsbA family protein [Sphingomonas sp. H39-1-10]|uniref:DsbA family protein n=1 Tax=Sphingomonas TaxID=13687 RepID=UPI00088626F6|nr:MULTISPECIES: DsbA family protein [Sphingomonas]MDF0490880.1 DsbA family protein [Sphingomonas pollutisoli]SDA21847.1 Protein-disulfide isomerase [Sphingomonas sp. NFR15]